MTPTRTLTAAVFALTLAAGPADAQTRPQAVKLPANAVRLPKPQAQLNPALTSPGVLQIPAGVKDRLNAADLAVTGIQVGADDVVRVTVRNVGRSATTRVVKMMVATSGTGNLQNPADAQLLDVPVMAAGEQRVFQTNRFLMPDARDEVDGAGVILVAANVDKLEQLAEPSEANNVLVISTK